MILDLSEIFNQGTSLFFKSFIFEFWAVGAKIDVRVNREKRN